MHVIEYEMQLEYCKCCGRVYQNSWCVSRSQFQMLFTYNTQTLSLTR